MTTLKIEKKQIAIILVLILVLVFITIFALSIIRNTSDISVADEDLPIAIDTDAALAVTVLLDGTPSSLENEPMCSAILQLTQPAGGRCLSLTSSATTNEVSLDNPVPITYTLVSENSAIDNNAIRLQVSLKGSNIPVGQAADEAYRDGSLVKPSVINELEVPTYTFEWQPINPDGTTIAIGEYDIKILNNGSDAEDVPACQLSLLVQNDSGPRCGDGICNSSESGTSEYCEVGEDNTGYVCTDNDTDKPPSGDPISCRGIGEVTGTPVCTYCGDGIKNGDEECDFNDTNTSDSCTNQCDLIIENADETSFVVTKDVTEVCLETGETRLSYTISIQNTSTVTASVNRIDDTFDARLTSYQIVPQSITPSFGTVSGNNLIWETTGQELTFNPQETKTFTYIVTIPATNLQQLKASPVSNTVSVSYERVEGESTNRSFSVSTPLSCSETNSENTNEPPIVNPPLPNTASDSFPSISILMLFVAVAGALVTYRMSTGRMLSSIYARLYMLNPLIPFEQKVQKSRDIKRR